MQLVLCSLLAVFFGPFSAAVAEQFPAGVRSTGLALAYNLAVMIFGGFAQFIVTWLIQNTGVPIAPVFYVLFAVVLGLVGAFCLIDRTHEARLAVVDEDSAAQPTTQAEPAGGHIRSAATQGA